MGLSINDVCAYYSGITDPEMSYYSHNRCKVTDVLLLRSTPIIDVMGLIM